MCLTHCVISKTETMWTNLQILQQTINQSRIKFLVYCGYCKFILRGGLLKNSEIISHVDSIGLIPL